MAVGRKPVHYMVLIGMIAAIGLVLGACGGSESPSPTATTAPVATAAPTATTPPATATTAPTATTAAAQSTPAGGGELYAKGEELYQKTAGGVGCASCHGPEGRGNEAIGAPDHRGADASRIRNALESVEAMSFIELKPADIDALEVYLAYLATLP